MFTILVHAFARLYSGNYNGNYSVAFYWDRLPSVTDVSMQIVAQMLSNVLL